MNEGMNEWVVYPVLGATPADSIAVLYIGFEKKKTKI